MDKQQNNADYLNKVLDMIPKQYSRLIDDVFTYKRVPKEYFLSSILFAFSTSIGLTFFIEALGYRNYANLYFAIIGSRGDAKSESMKIATHPIKVRDDLDYEDYLIEKKIASSEEEAIIRKQVLIQNASIEAVHKIHFENINSVGISIDEIYGLVDKMGNSNSRDGIAWRNFFLEGYTNGVIDVSRKTTESFRISESYPTLLGGLQHQFVPQLFANGNLESGFIDRLLFTPKITSNNKLIKGEIPKDALNDYAEYLNRVLDYKRQSEKEEEPIKKFKIHLSDNAETKLFEYVQELIKRQEHSQPIFKEYMSKMQISIHKLCIIAYFLENSIDGTFASMLNIANIELAIAFNEFYYENFKQVVTQNLEKKNIEVSTNAIINMAKKNKASQKAVAEVTGKHKGTISKMWNNK